MSPRRFRPTSPVLLVALAVGCDPAQPLRPEMDTSSSRGAGPTLAPPSNIVAVAASESQIDVSWQDNSTNETGFQVYRSTTGDGGPFTYRATAGPDDTRYSDGGLTPSTQYCYRVRAVGTRRGKTVYSSFSPAACATTAPPSPPPSAPTAVAAALTLDQWIEVRWADNSSNEAGFRIERSTDDGTSWVTVYTTGANWTSFSDYTFPTEQLVCYRVVAFNSMGDSPSSNTSCTARPAAPGSLTFALVDATVIDLAWDDNSSFEDGYVVLGSQGGYFVPVATLPANATSVRLELGVPTCGVFYVRALKEPGYSYPSEQLVVDPYGECF